MQTFRRDNEDRMLLGTKDAQIAYHFYGGGLCRVDARWWPQTTSTLEAMQKNLMSAWGEPVKTEQLKSIRILEWSSPSGMTRGLLQAMEDVQSPEEDWVIRFVVEAKDCAKAADQNFGL